MSIEGVIVWSLLCWIVISEWQMTFDNFFFVNSFNSIFFCFAFFYKNQIKTTKKPQKKKNIDWKSTKNRASFTGHVAEFLETSEFRITFTQFPILLSDDV